MSAFISILILILLCAVGIWLLYWLWVYKKWGLVVLLGVFMCGALEVHSIMYPQKDLKEKYARLID